jgi:hypothetical protein
VEGRAGGGPDFENSKDLKPWVQKVGENTWRECHLVLSL